LYTVIDVGASKVLNKPSVPSYRFRIKRHAGATFSEALVLLDSNKCCCDTLSKNLQFGAARQLSTRGEEVIKKLNTH
jgi:hypothetical protein